MVTTRKKARISYAEADRSDGEPEPVASTSTLPANGTADDHPESSSTGKKSKAAAHADTGYGDGLDGDGFNPTGRNYQKRGRKRRKSASIAPKKPVFDYARILELPADILCSILSHVPVKTLYILSISSKKLEAFLHSKTSASIWKEARKRMTVYAPKFFLNILFRDSVTTPPSNPLAHFEFDYLDTDGEYEALLNKEMEYFENESAKLPLIVPDPPPGISEFSMIRYLFCNVCYHCGKDGKSYMSKVPELLAHFCKSCFTRHTTPWKLALTDFEAELTPDRFVEIPDYTQFLLTLPSWKICNSESHNYRDEPLLPKDRRIYIGDLQQRYEDYKSRKTSMSKQDFDAWLVKTINEHHEGRKLAGRLSEYLWLKSTFDRYEPRVKQMIRGRNEREIKAAILERLESDCQYSKADAQVILSKHTNLYSSLAWKGHTLENEDWQTVKVLVKDYMEDYKKWQTTNPTMRYLASVRAVSDYFSVKMLLPKSAALINDMVFNNGHYLSLPKIKAILLEQPDDLNDAERMLWVTHRMAKMDDILTSDMHALCMTIKKDLVRKVLRKKGKSIAKLDTWDNDKLQDVLDKPDVWFRCAICKVLTPVPWRRVTDHACTANTKGEKAYGNRAHGIPDSPCIPVGWQPESVELVDGFEGLHGLLETFAREIRSEMSNDIGGEAAETLFDFPSSHMAMMRNDKWKFHCRVNTCWSHAMYLREILPHLAEHVRAGKTSIEQLREVHIPTVYTQNMSYAPSDLGYGFDSDEYDSDVVPGYDFF